MDRPRTGKQNRRLRNFLIHPSFQMKVMVFFFLPCVGFILLNNFTFYVFAKRTIEAFASAFGVLDIVTASVYSDLLGILWWFFAIGLIIAATISLTTIVLTHRILGPLKNFERIIGEVTSGNHKARVTLRANDELKPLAASFNKMLDTLSRG